MPQMAPINWLSLFIIFSMTFLLFSMMNYYLFTPSMPKLFLMKNKLHNSLNWKW
uniref:ATP synthase F0 subunit 8 n=1 Tax=Vibrissina turrita TaxID=569024 RepID=UPI0027A15899|nr:ATP synthase F0 subunit 8 [Vibrissina turrita]WEG23101.1 ATP synthase F0 subunit 8 [Compsilura concinnata]WPJ85696.1 ATP synthase F0 subunit 8 [Vibrissina turrita]